MDGQRFDQLTRSFATRATRRTVVRGLAGAVGGLLGLGTAARALGQTCRAAGSMCSQNGNCCSGLCDTANADPRQRNKCVCPPGQENCRGNCKTAPTDYLSDVLNCGACGNRCPIDQCNRATCVQGVCGLEPDPKRVGKSCNDGNCCTEGDVCLPNGVCQGTPVACRPNEVCEMPGTGVCNPTTCQCDFTLRPPDFVCRDAVDDCDVAEHCTGASPFCPEDAFQPGSVVCRPAIGDCDVAEHCPGDGPHCPPDAFKAAGAICRAAAGDCDIAEACDGTSPHCPTDQFKPSSVVCRPVAGDCDIAEHCPGDGPHCPPDAFKAAGAICRAAAGLCNPAERCTGNSPECPTDVVVGGVPCHSACCAAPEVCLVRTGANPSCGIGGGEGQPCRIDIASRAVFCDSGLVCIVPAPGEISARCGIGGGEGQPCRIDTNGVFCDQGLTCVVDPDDFSSAVCSSCGSLDERCCFSSGAPSGACDSGLTCDLDLSDPLSSVCRPCGGPDELCCGLFERTCDPGNFCAGGLPPSLGVCQPCGQRGQVCCSGECASGLTCSAPSVANPAGTCLAPEDCGSAGQPCCGEFNECDEGLSCGAGQCLGPGDCGSLGQPCCGLDCDSSNLTCSFPAEQCVACGAQDQPCCNFSCNPGLSCELGGLSGFICL